MATDAEIIEEVEELGRLTPKQEDVIYTISKRQDELGYQPTNMFLEKLIGNEDYRALMDRGYLDYYVANPGGKREIAILTVPLKGLRYCRILSEEIADRQEYNSAGARRI